MRYEYTYRNTGKDIWQLSMYSIYSSMAGMCNGIFTVAMIMLAYVRWDVSGLIFKILVLLGCFLFPVIQPLVIYWRAKKAAYGIKQDTQIGFDEVGIHIKSGSESHMILWNHIKRIVKRPTMILIFSDSTHGFVLTNRVLKGQRNDCYQYVLSKIKRRN